MDTVKQTQSAYGVIATDYTCYWQDRSILEPQLKQFASLLKPDSLVLDVGCGPGFDTAVLRQHGLQAVGLDLSWEMLRAGYTELNIGGDFVQADMRLLPFVETFDGIWSSASLLHLPRSETPIALHNFARVLKPGGLLYLSVKLGDGEGWHKDPYVRKVSRFFTFWQPGTLDSLLAETGFDMIAGTLQEGTKDSWIIRFARKR